MPNLRIDADFSSTTLSSKVKDAELMRIPYIITIGDKEEKEKTLAVRVRGNKKIKSVTMNDFVEKIDNEIKGRK